MMDFIIGFFSGILSGMGIGGGAILIPSLLYFKDITQQQAQITNLLYFIPTAVISLFFHKKNGNLETKILKPIIIFGIFGAIIGSIIAINIKPDYLKKIFGVFLFAIGINELFKKK